VTTREKPEYSIRYPLQYNLGDEVLLLGYDAPDTIGLTFPLTLYWQGVTDMKEDYTVFVHVFDEGGSLLGQDDRQPCRGSYPTNLWTEGWTVEDRHFVDISGAMSPGRHRLRIVVGMYLLEGMERLSVLDMDGTRARHDQIVIVQDVQMLGETRLYVPLMQKP
jgi:hypothetical protein